MTARTAISSRPRARRGAAALAGLLALCVAAAGCTSSAGDDLGQPSDDTASTTPTATAPPESEATVTANIAHRARNVPVDEVVKLSAENGTLDRVTVTIGKGKQRLKGRLSPDRTVWTSTERLEPGLRYTVQARAVDDEGLVEKSRTRFHTQDLTLDQQTFPSIAPLPGETVGVGMPVIVQFDVAVTDRASIERHLSVETSPRQVGAWAWLSDHEVHWRPKHYWKPGTQVTVHADINSVSAGNGIYGQKSRSASFRIGDAMISKIDVAKHRMKVFRNGDLLRTIPISAGKDGFATRSGTKVIMEKFRTKTMDASTIGIDRNDPEYYNINDVEYAMRVTYSGEFLHAAPWSVGSQGSANVSHGCIGMSTADAAWLYNLSRRGDVVQVTGTNKYMEPGNGYTDWNKSFAEYKQGSALS